FADFRPWQAHVQTSVDGKFYPWPLNRETLQWFVDGHRAPGWGRRTWNPQNFAEAMTDKMSQHAFEKFIRGYTEKQWGVPCEQLAPELANRLEIRERADETQLSLHEYQGLPKLGYTQWIANMLHGIKTYLNLDFLSAAKDLSWNKLIFTGPI